MTFSHGLIANRTTKLLVLLWFAVTSAPAAADCINQPAPFDGIKPLRYAAAVGSTDGGAARLLQSGVILNSDGSSIDATRTRAVFGHPDRVDLAGSVGGKQTLQGGPDYRSIGNEVGIFQFRALYYFDTFYTRLDRGDFGGWRRNDPALRDTLGVFLHRFGHTKQVCEYFVREQGA